MSKKIFITDFDMKRFKWLSSNAHQFDDAYKKQMSELDKELLNAIVVDQKDIPPDVITMNSQFTVKDLQTNEIRNYTLVFPFDADAAQNKLSVINPLGVAVIGYKAGDIIEWNFPEGRRIIKIEEVIYQPEREGNYYV